MAEKKNVMTIGRIFEVFTESGWWQASSDQFMEILKLGEQRFLLLYHADADGFCAGYFISRVLRQYDRQNSTPVTTRAVWNFEFDFAWLPEYCRQSDPSIIICVDIPIIEAVDVLRKISGNPKIVIYDHHVVWKSPEDHENVLYVNSRLLDSNQADHPAGYFAASLAYKSGILRKEEIALLACSLHCDKSLGNNEPVLSFLAREFTALPGRSISINSVIKHFTSQINIYFKGNPQKTSGKLLHQVADFIDNHSFVETTLWFSENFDINDADKRVSREVGFFLRLLRNAVVSEEGLLCEVLACETFCVGIIASVLSAEKRAAVVAVGYHAGDKMAFEIRTREDNNVNLADLLKKQRDNFIPLTSGGHPKAAGALILSKDIGRFRRSFRKSLGECGISVV